MLLQQEKSSKTIFIITLNVLLHNTLTISLL